MKFMTVTKTDSNPEGLLPNGGSVFGRYSRKKWAQLYSKADMHIHKKYIIQLGEGIAHLNYCGKLWNMLLISYRE
jgi:hypothetical protein